MNVSGGFGGLSGMASRLPVSLGRGLTSIGARGGMPSATPINIRQLGGLRGGAGQLGAALRGGMANIPLPTGMPSPGMIPRMGGIPRMIPQMQFKPTLTQQVETTPMGAGQLPLRSSLMQNISQTIPGISSVYQGTLQRTGGGLQPVGRPTSLAGSLGRPGTPFIGGMAGDYLRDLGNTYRSSATAGRGLLGAPLQGAAGVGARVLSDIGNIATGDPVGRPLSAWKMPAMMGLGMAPNFSLEGSSDPLTGLNPADAARIKLRGGGALSTADVSALRPTADNALNTLSDSMIKSTTGMTKTQLRSLASSNPEAYVRLLGT